VSAMNHGVLAQVVQAIASQHRGTLTRLICDDKGTSLVGVFDAAHQAVLAALEITEAVHKLAGSYRAQIGARLGRTRLLLICV
jgi:hypothetical protein